MKTCFTSVVLTVTAMGAGAPAWAENQPPLSDSAQQSPLPQAVEIDTVTVRGKRITMEKGYKAERSDITGVNTSILDTPYSIDVVTQEQLQDKQPQTLEEAVKGISGLTQGNNLAGTLDTVMRRGYGSNRDGSIMRNGLASSMARNFTANVERVEVLKGPASMLYGMQNPGGVINVVTKKPDYTKNSTAVNVGYGNYAARNLGIDTTGPIGNSGFAYRLVADYQTKNYWRSFGSNTEYVIAPSLSWKNDKTKVSAGYEYQNYEGVFDRGTFLDVSGTAANNPNYGKALDIPLKRRLDDPINVTKGYSHTFQLSGEHKLNADWRLQAEYGFSKNHYNDWQARVMSYNAAKREVSRRIDGTRPSDAVTHSLNLSANGLVDQGENITHKLRASLQLQDYKLKLGDLRRSATRHTMSVDNPIYGQNWIESTNPTADARTSDTLEHYKTAALLLQDSAYIGNRWIVSGGVRGQWHKIESGQGRPARFRNHSSGFDLLPQIGAVYLLNPRWSVYGNFGTSAKPNASRNIDYGGKKIPLEKSRQFEVGSKYNGENLSANLALFHIKKSNVARPVTLDNGEVETRVIEKNRSQGMEVDVNGKITDKLGISANYTFTDTKVIEDKNEPLNEGTQFDSIPKHTAGLTLFYDFGRAAGGNWRAGAGLDYRGTWGFNYVRNNQAQWFKLPSATTYSAFVSYDTKVGGKPLNVRLTGKNLGNKQYFVSHTTATMEHLSIGEPRTVTLGAKLSF
ncbi:TonB-dependent siderophore receptor [Neisseria canis]|uniref:Putative TonB-dependent receptor n=1 Tax=Neisseria canis TaxID=493 RepID=A0A448D6S3_9NEIS|nr:TonB-dependent receptor [Neisseria canis]OSI12751.1 TonB-dependent siderophore receptor [Neisseria canis]VEE99962.1 putative TonB-dependent receptor [Neisseria canis]